MQRDTIKNKLLYVHICLTIILSWIVVPALMYIFPYISSFIGIIYFFVVFVSFMKLYAFLHKDGFFEHYECTLNYQFESLIASISAISILLAFFYVITFT